MKRVDIMTEIRGTFTGRCFRRCDLLNALDLADTKRAKSLWNAMRNQSMIVKTPHKDFELVTPEKKVAKIA